MDLVHTETIRAKGFEGGYQKAVMPSGLTVLLYPTEGLSTAHCLLGCKVGSQDCAFFDGEEEVRIPAGVAHFLEHKLFESEEGDLFLKFAKTGASANAYTSFDRTCYLFTATQNVAQSVDILLGQIGAPYLTDENVEKEKGIIAQEIKMYDDDPDWRSTFDLLGCLYHNDPVKEDIAGTVDSIQKIDRATLERVHRLFYDPRNMVLAVAGNIDPKQILEVCQKRCSQPPEAPFSLRRERVYEPREIVKTYAEESLQIAVPLVTVGFKEAPVESPFDRVVDTVILELLTGETSDFYREMYEAGIIGPTFGYDVFSGDSYHALLFSCETQKTGEFSYCLYAAIEKARREGLPREDFERIKKGIYGRYIRTFGRPEAIATALVGAHFQGCTLYDSIDFIKSLRFAAVQARFAEILRQERSAVSIIWPKKEER